jgi:hypothetical protein
MNCQVAAERRTELKFRTPGHLRCMGKCGKAVGFSAGAVLPTAAGKTVRIPILWDGGDFVCRHGFVSSKKGVARMKKVLEWGVPALALMVLGGVAVAISRGRPAPALPVSQPSPPSVLSGEVAAVPAGAVLLPPRFFSQLTLPAAIAAGKPVVIELGGGATGSARLELGQREVVLVSATQGTRRVAWTPLPNAKVVVGRQGGRLIVAQGAQVVADLPGAGDWRWLCGRDGCAGMPATALQKTAPVFFDDDFMHEENSFGEWKCPGGQWKINQVGKTVGGSPLRSPNAFSMTGENHAVATAGQWFWNNYTASWCCRNSSMARPPCWARRPPASFLSPGAVWKLRCCTVICR